MSYGYVLYYASNLIGEGSELLLLVPSMAGLVGGVVLPLLGAVPDGGTFVSPQKIHKQYCSGGSGGFLQMQYMNCVCIMGKNGGLCCFLIAWADTDALFFVNLNHPRYLL